MCPVYTNRFLKMVLASLFLGSMPFMACFKMWQGFFCSKVLGLYFDGIILSQSQPSLIISRLLSVWLMCWNLVTDMTEVDQ